MAVVQVFMGSGGIWDQYNLASDKFLAPITVGDPDHDGKKEIFLTVQNQDSISVLMFSPFDQSKGANVKKVFLDNMIGLRGSITGAPSNGLLYDINNDKFDESLELLKDNSLLTHRETL